MFTGELPSTHGAHFQSMAMRRDVPTLASVLGSAGFETELISRNPVFDGSIPGLCRGFEQTTRFLAQRGKG
jgi:arylsulfatase A-like enzyme